MYIINTCVHNLIRVIEMQQENRQRVVKSYVRFQGLRHLSRELKKLLFLALKKKWLKWTKYTKYENIRFRNILEVYIYSMCIHFYICMYTCIYMYTLFILHIYIYR
jgi:ATP-dependent Lon protease